MTDIFDRASKHEEEDRADALAAQTRRARLSGKTVNDSALNCCVCDDLIPEARRQALPGVQTLERDFLKWQAELPVHYVRREDYVRGQSVIEAKLDALFSKLEVVQIKGAQHD